MQHTPGPLGGWEWFSHLSFIFVSKRYSFSATSKSFSKVCDGGKSPCGLIHSLWSLGQCELDVMHACITACCVCTSQVCILCMHVGMLCVHVSMLCLDVGIQQIHVDMGHVVHVWWHIVHAWWREIPLWAHPQWHIVMIYYAYMMAYCAWMLAWSVQWML